MEQQYWSTLVPLLIVTSCNCIQSSFGVTPRFFDIHALVDGSFMVWLFLQQLLVHHDYSQQSYFASEFSLTSPPREHVEGTLPRTCSPNVHAQVQKDTPDPDWLNSQEVWKTWLHYCYSFHSCKPPFIRSVNWLCSSRKEKSPIKQDV